MQFKVLYEDDNILAIDKPAGIVVFPEGNIQGKTMIDHILEKYPDFKNAGVPLRYGVVHRLDRDTSGILLVAKNSKTLEFLQKQFKDRKVVKKYLALVVGNIKNKEGKVETLIGRHPKDRNKQKVFLPHQPGSQGKRIAVTSYRVIEEFPGYTLLEVTPKTGRKHQIRTQLSYLNHPITGDKLYGFKNQPKPKNLSRHFLHASYLMINLPDNKSKEFYSELPEDLKKTLENIKMTNV